LQKIKFDDDEEKMKKEIGIKVFKQITKIKGKRNIDELGRLLGLDEDVLAKEVEEEGVSWESASMRSTRSESTKNIYETKEDLILKKAQDRFEKEMGKEKSESFFKNIEKQSSEEQAKILNEYIKQNLITQGKEEKGIKADLTNKDLVKAYNENTDRIVDALDGKKAKTSTVVNQNNINNNSGGKQPQQINKNQYSTKRK
jgi:hypothetical protein